MSIAYISDIHGNATALEAVLKDIKEQNIERVVVLGDLCYRGRNRRNHWVLSVISMCPSSKGMRMSG
ncbi:metallophosphoesterase family protein [Salimicrobium sp. PL1-032A]|uniref:metallophosphoesterase family protein n=1 Tax=Salimicrobium sp. PL1-032A TaxID=3095364 RepID=UPI00325FFFCB